MLRATGARYQLQECAGLGIPALLLARVERSSSLRTCTLMPTVFSRRDGADAVVMSLDHYQSIMETMHLLSTPANAAHLAKSIAQHKAGKATRRELVKG
jgi:PHD/YefM family antitoxin component YafN of YafNO toxin-antitoxin module